MTSRRLLCVECESANVTFLGPGSKYIAIDHYRCRDCDAEFMIKRHRLNERAKRKTCSKTE